MMVNPNENPAPTEVEDDPLKPFKAIAAMVLPVIVMFIGFKNGTSDGGSSITSGEWQLLVVGGLGTLGITYVVPNPKRKKL